MPSALAGEKTPGLIVGIDPTTGEFLPQPPAGGVTPSDKAEAAKVPAPQLHEVPSPTPGGGVMVELKDRFLTPLVATVDADGKVKLKHQPGISIDAATK